MAASIDFSKVPIDRKPLDTPPLEEVANEYMNGSRMAASLDVSKVPIERIPLHTPSLEEVANVLSSGLSCNFDSVTVSVTDSPDLTQDPYMLTSPGLCGNPVLIDLGGIPHIIPKMMPEKLYDMAALLRHLERDPALLIGTGAGPWPFTGCNCEGINVLSINNNQVIQGSYAVSVQPVGAEKGKSGYKLQNVPAYETRVAMLGNYLLSDGSPGEVIKIVAEKRTGELDFITSIRDTLIKHYGDKVMGLGGTFVLRRGKAKHHVMPDFSKTPINTDEEVDNWLHFFEMKAPITHVGTITTGDLGLDLRPQHFHGFSGHGDGGHYYNDTTPQNVLYEGYFTLANEVIRVDRPTETHNIGKGH